MIKAREKIFSLVVRPSPKDMQQDDRRKTRQRQRETQELSTPRNQESLAQETHFTSIFSCQSKFRGKEKILTLSLPPDPADRDRGCADVVRPFPSASLCQSPRVQRPHGGGGVLGGRPVRLSCSQRQLLGSNTLSSTFKVLWAGLIIK